MINRKYKLLDPEDIALDGRLDVVARRIRALRDFGDVKAGDIGGYVTSEDNLAHEGNCWVGSGAVCVDAARVQNDALLLGNASACQNVIVENQAVVGERVRLRDKARVGGRAKLFGDVCVFGGATVYGDVEISGRTSVGDTCCVFGYARISGYARLRNMVSVSDYVHISGRADIECKVNLTGRQVITATPVILSGLRWPVVICDKFITIGCQQHYVGQWEKFDFYDISDFAHGAADFWEKWRDVIIGAAKIHQSSIPKK